MTNLEYKTIENMSKSGNPFIIALSELFKKSNRKDFDTLKFTFNTYWKIYANTK